MDRFVEIVAPNLSPKVEAHDTNMFNFLCYSTVNVPIVLKDF